MPSPFCFEHHHRVVIQGLRHKDQRICSLSSHAAVKIQISRERRPTKTNTFRAKFWDWIPVLLWCGVIFTASTSHFSAAETSRWIEPLLHRLFPAASVMKLSVLHFLVRKLGHFTEYGIFLLVLIRGPLKEHAVLALGICVFYALSDEFHQIFVPLRTPSLYDVALDSSGAMFTNFIHQSILEFF
jgi:VanZ family protein